MSMNALDVGAGKGGEGGGEWRGWWGEGRGQVVGRDELGEDGEEGVEG